MLLRPATIQSICDGILLLGNHTPLSASLECKKGFTLIKNWDTNKI